jgi:hypothetical protein
MTIGAPKFKDVNTTAAAGEDLENTEKTLTVNDALIQRLDANGGSTDVLLPAEAAGLEVWIVNTGGEDLVVKEDGDSTTIVTVATTEDARLWCDGVAWQGNVSDAT